MVGLLVTSSYVIWNLITKSELLESWIENFINTVNKVNVDLKKLDYKGYFEADDEVGVIFNEIKNTINLITPVTKIEIGDNP